jgi:four helix bundle protein
MVRRNYKKIVAWQRGHELTLQIYRITSAFPSEERFGMISQLRRAAYSVPANITEGSGRGTKKDYLRFLYIALGSLKETEYFLFLSHDLGYLETAEYENVSHLVNQTFATLEGLMKAVEKEVGVLGKVMAYLLAALILGIGKHVATCA